MQGFDGIMPSRSGQRLAQHVQVAAQGVAGFLRLAPDQAFDFIAADHPAGVAHQQFQDAQALGREPDVLAVEAHGQA